MIPTRVGSEPEIYHKRHNMTRKQQLGVWLLLTFLLVLALFRWFNLAQ
jgi:hypothetical protein